MHRERGELPSHGAACPWPWPSGSSWPINVQLSLESLFEHCRHPRPFRERALLPALAEPKWDQLLGTLGNQPDAEPHGRRRQASIRIPVRRNDRRETSASAASAGESGSAIHADTSSNLALRIRAPLPNFEGISIVRFRLAATRLQARDHPVTFFNQRMTPSRPFCRRRINVRAETGRRTRSVTRAGRVRVPIGVTRNCQAQYASPTSVRRSMTGRSSSTRAGS